MTGKQIAAPSPNEPNRLLRRSGFLSVRPGPFGEVFDTFESRAFAVCDHQIAHIYVSNPADIHWVRAVIAPMAGVARVFGGETEGVVAMRLDDRYQPDDAR